MAGLSKSLYIGRLTRDPELKKINVKGEEVSVVNFTIAVDKEVGEGADFYNIVAWRGLADTVARFMTKGRLVFVEGRSTLRSYEVEKEGVKFQNYVTETHATKVDFLDRAPQQETRDTPAKAVQNETPVSVYGTISDEDLPW